jgi:hypothetical protein
LVSFDALEFPVIALEGEIEVDLGIASQLHFYRLGEIVLVLDHHLHSQLLGLLQSLNHLRLLLDFYDEAVLATVDGLAPLGHRWIAYIGCWLDHHIKQRSVSAFIHSI